MIQDVVKDVIKDLEKLESDRQDREGCSQNRFDWKDETWLKDAYHNTLRTAIALKQLLNKQR